MMLYHDKKTLQEAISPFRDEGLIGFVPTMGALHSGHLELVKTSAKENVLTIVSIFVNPTQFDNPDDLKSYPRTLESDIELLKALNEQIIIFAPSVEEMYANQVEANAFDFDGLDKEMEGAFRPGHFDGVGTIVSKLFDLVLPDKAYFGEKDFQQLQIIRKLVENLDLHLEIVPCPIVREESGLAKSSRNQRLNAEQYEQASLIYEVLKEVKNKFNGTNLAELQDWVTKQFDNHPLFKLDYFDIADEATLKSIDKYDPNNSYRAFIAVFVDDVRLIDNMQLN